MQDWSRGIFSFGREEAARRSRRQFLKQSAAATALVGLAGRASAFARAESDGADLVVVNARVWTGDPRRPDAQGFAIRDGIFVAVGSNDEVRRWATSATRIEDADGLYIIPGFTDCHNHGNGQTELYYPIVGNPYTIEFFTVDRMVEILQEAVPDTPDGHWIIGKFFDDTKLEDGEELTKDALDRVSDRHPVRVDHRGGHTKWYNSKAFELAGITEDSPDPEFGAFVRGPDGRLTGQVAEKANDVFVGIAPEVELPAEAATEGLAFISKKFVEFGLTSVHMSAPNIDALREVRSRGDLLHRVSYEPRFSDLDAIIDEGLTTGAGDEWIRLGAMAEFAVDGSFSERTLRSVEPYDSKNPPNGLFTASQEQADEVAEKCVRNGIQINMHLNGDGGIDRGLTAIERAQHFRPRPAGSYISDFRPKITHCSIINPDLALAQRLKAVNAIPQLFSSYIYYNSEKWHLYGDEIMSRAMAYRTLLDTGLKVVQGTDYAPGPFDSLMSLQGMVTRTGWNGETWGANQAVSVDEALTVLTVNPAHASYEEGIKGSISVGKLADYVVLSDDPHTAPDQIIGGIELVRTVVGGTTAYER